MARAELRRLAAEHGKQWLAAGRPLTRKQLVRGLKDAGRPHGVGTVAKALAELTKAGDLVNPKDKRGYRLPGWPRPPATPSLFT